MSALLAHKWVSEVCLLSIDADSPRELRLIGDYIDQARRNICWRDYHSDGVVVTRRHIDGPVMKVWYTLRGEPDHLEVWAAPGVTLDSLFDETEDE